MIYFSVAVWLFLYFLPPFLFLNSGYNFEILQITTINLSFLLGLILAMYLTRNITTYQDYTNSYKVDARLFYFLFLVYFVVKFSTIIDITQNLIQGSYVEYAYNKAIDRYEGSSYGNMSFFTRLGIVAFLMSGAVASVVKGSKKLVLFLFTLMILIESSSLARLGVLLVFITYVVEVVIRKNSYIQSKSVFSLLKLGLLLLLLLFFIFFFSAYFRVAHNDDVINIVFYKLGVYTIAMYEALFIWMQNIGQYGDGYGTNTLAGIYKIFGYTTEQGFYKLVNTEFGPTNIYTNLRGFIADYGYFGTSVLFFTFGFILAYFSKVRYSNLTYMFLRLILFLLIFLLFSPFIHFLHLYFQEF